MPLPYEFWEKALQSNPLGPGEAVALGRALGYTDLSQDWFNRVLTDIRFSLDNSTGALTFLNGVHGRSRAVIEEPDWFEPRCRQWLGYKNSLRKVKDNTFRELPSEYVLRVYAYRDASYKDGWIEYLMLDIVVYEDELDDLLERLSRKGHPPAFSMRYIEQHGSHDLNKGKLSMFLSSLRADKVERSPYSHEPEGYDITARGYYSAHQLLFFAPEEPTKGYKTLRSKVARTRVGKALREIKKTEDVLRPILEYRYQKLPDPPMGVPIEQAIKEFETRQLDFTWRISAEPIDVATMTYQRPWKSCAQPGGAGELTPIYDILAGSVVLFYYRGGPDPVGREILRPAVYMSEKNGLMPIVVRSGVVYGSGGNLDDYALQQAIKQQTGLGVHVETASLESFNYAVRHYIMDDFDRSCGRQQDDEIDAALQAIKVAFGPMILQAWRNGKLQQLLPQESAKQLAREAKERELAMEDVRMRQEAQKILQAREVERSQRRKERWKKIAKARTAINSYTHAVHRPAPYYYFTRDVKRRFQLTPKTRPTERVGKLGRAMWQAIDDVVKATGWQGEVDNLIYSIMEDPGSLMR